MCTEMKLGLCKREKTVTEYKWAECVIIDASGLMVELSSL